MPNRRYSSMVKTVFADPSPRSTKLPFLVFKPGGNITALVTQPTPRRLQPNISRSILRLNPDIEQVGFIEKPTNPSAHFRLQMMGGEFCLNASRSAADYWSTRFHTHEIIMEASGLDRPLNVDVEDHRVTVCIDKGFYIGSSHKKNLDIVDLSGIRHIVVPCIESEKEALKLIKKYQEGWDAVGVIGTTVRGKTISIDPLIWVRRTNSLIRETACGSGSVAAAIVAHNHHGNEEDFDIVQPSGQMYDVHLSCNQHAFVKIHVCGMVEELGERSIKIPQNIVRTFALSR